MNLTSEHEQILSLLAKIIVKALDRRQQQSVLRGYIDAPSDLARLDEYVLFKMLKAHAIAANDISFVRTLTDRIRASQAFFYQNAGQGLVQLEYLVQSTIQESKRIANVQPYVFVLLPFKKEFFAVYEEVIKPSLTEAGCLAEHADEVKTVDSIIDIILSRIEKSDFLVADTSGKNPNVFYEVGYAHARGKKVILLTQDAGDLPFDVRHWRHIIYDRSKLHVLEREFTAVVQSLLQEINK